jgi:ubiquinone/menaquinone biosynthesis C-methylase UbiE
MIERILEPEVMDTPEEAFDYDQMDHAAVNRCFVEDLLAQLRTSAGAASLTVLDLGTGTAQIPVELCRRDSAVKVVAVDAAAHMLSLAALNIDRAGLTDRIEARRVDAKRLPFADKSFAAVMSNSIVHHIPEPHSVVAEAIRVAAPGGLLFFRDLMRPADEATLAQLVQQYAGDANERQQRMFAESLHAALTVEEVQTLVAAEGLPPDAVRATSDRHWTWACRLPP